MDELSQRLSGRVIALPETRQLDLFADMLEKRGASTRRCPLVGIHDSQELESIEQWIQRYIQSPFDDFILLTGEGLRRLLGFADRAGVRDEFVKAMAASRTITRGPKPARELRLLGYKSGLPAAAPTTEGVIESLASEDLSGRQVAVQLYGDNPNTPLMDFLDKAGATAWPVAPYRYADAAESEAVIALIHDMAAGQIDAIGFTSSPQITRLSKVARQAQLEAELAEGMGKTLVAAVGPLVADSLRQAGFTVDLMPSDSFFLKPLVNDLCSRLGPAKAQAN